MNSVSDPRVGPNWRGFYAEHTHTSSAIPHKTARNLIVVK